MTSPHTILCYVTDRKSLAIPAGSSREAALLERIARASTAGVDWIELREKDLDTLPLLELTRATVAAVSATPTRVLVNDRLDVALAAGAHGVHLAETSMPASAVTKWKREAKRADFLVGVSCHSLKSAEAAARAGADYIFFGPVFATASKAAFGPPQGLPKLAEVCGGVTIPVVAVGGINVENVQACMRAKAAGIAAIGLVQQAADLTSLVRNLRRIIAEGAVS
jgi:thiamine-phosphate pyrophosphorylase